MAGIEVLIFDVIIAYILDLIFGDPYWMPHPVRFIGLLIKKTEAALRKLLNKASIEGDVGAMKVKEKAAGFLLALIVVLTTFFAVFLLLQIAKAVHPVMFHVLNIYFIYSALAAKCLAHEANKVYRVLKTGNLIEARKSLAMLVGRETDGLSEKEVIRGVVETTAENTVDGVTSPLIYAVLGSLFGLGAPLVYAFKAISTLDSMVGYMNNKYRHFGFASAKIDDLANYLPARLTGVLIPVSAFLLRKSFSKSMAVMLRDRRNHKSPNCAYPEAAVAGALGIRIGGTNVYFGKVMEKPTIGDPDKELETKDIKETIRLMYMTSFITLLLMLSLVAILTTVD
ncbi:MAG: adenosylcobinamide-phosphate synthase CbiB [Clostridia bacterium]|nr:adenosylcobinamide-phosphate synthase CbiB [Clostridia bacterium]